ncbi:glycosyltransferase [Acinetobacter lwoffii]|uniref:glycosyltransferase n=1 Tax=Acinetobacter lwoffii TaxID=28090 RepID=UPI0015835B37|nr:glycosyltransferase [Acinetobacter lwoffii]QKT98893.1 glycosyltransferase [Acinetobacter lwoffii]
MVDIKELNVSDYLNNFGNNIAFIFPARIVGGHELMTIEIIKDLLDLNIEVTVYTEPSNSRLVNCFKELNSKIKIESLPVFQPKIEILQTYLNFLSLMKVEKFLKSMNNKYSSIIIAQGDIEIGSMYAYVGSKLNMKIISYLPYTHSAKLMGKTFYYFRDKLSSNIYKHINSYITIYMEAARSIKNKNIKSDVVIIRNKVRNLSEFKKMREDFLIHNKSKLFKIYLIGRIIFEQKGHDILVDALSMIAKNSLEKIELNIIGDGPDEDKLKDLVRLKCENLKVVYWGWKSEPWLEAFKADLLIIPSRFEGVPLVMLEALDIGVPILAKPCGGMLDYIESDNVFDNAEELAKIISKRI